MSTRDSAASEHNAARLLRPAGSALEEPQP